MKPLLALAALSIAAFADSLTRPPLLIRILQTIGAKPAVDFPASDVAAGIFLFGMTALTGPHTSFAGLEQFDSGGSHPGRGRNSGVMIHGRAIVRRRLSKRSARPVIFRYRSTARELV